MKRTKTVLGISGSLSTLLFLALNAQPLFAKNSTSLLKFHIADSAIQTAQSQTSSCGIALDQAFSSLTEGRQLSIASHFTRDTSENYSDYPVGHSGLYTIAIQGTASSSVMNSPQMLLSISEAFFDKCDTAGAITIVNLDSMANVETIGLVGGQPTFFECAQGLVTTRIPWGYHDCSP